jgi:hypothetical protein
MLDELVAVPYQRIAGGTLPAAVEFYGKIDAEPDPSALVEQSIQIALEAVTKAGDLSAYLTVLTTCPGNREDGGQRQQGYADLEEE